MGKPTAPPFYQSLSLGASGCDPGYEITTQAECDTAIAALGLCNTGLWVGDYTLTLWNALPSSEELLGRDAE